MHARRRRSGQRKRFAPGPLAASLLVVGLIVAGCGDDESEPTPAASAERPDLAALPLGDDRHSESPRAGFVYSCRTDFDPNAPGAATEGPWINSRAGTWDAERKIVVPGEVDWPSEFEVAREGDRRLVTGNALPNTPTGEFPIPSDSDAYRYDRNPNRIAEQRISLRLPATPSESSEPSCMGGESGLLLNGAALFNAFDARGQDAVAHEVQDECDGHPQAQGVYHHHSQSSCIDDNFPGEGHSPLIGYALDGFGIYGHHGEDGEVLANDDLDACHGHRHEIEWDGDRAEMFHYHATYEFPYAVGCFRGEPAAITVTQPG